MQGIVPFLLVPDSGGRQSEGGCQHPGHGSGVNGPLPLCSTCPADIKIVVMLDTNRGMN